MKPLISKRLTRDIAFFLLLVIFSLVFAKILSYFIFDVFLALVLTHIMRRFDDYLIHRRNARPTPAALLTILAALLFIVFPLSFVAIIITSEATSWFLLVKQHWPEILAMVAPERLILLKQQFPFLERYLQMLSQLDLQTELDKSLIPMLELGLTFIRNIALGMVLNIFHLFVSMFVMFFLLLEGDKLFEYIASRSPLKKEVFVNLFHETQRIIDGILMGYVVIGLIEGTCGGLIFFLFGLPSPLFWGLLMMILSITPFIGVLSVLVPTGLILIFTGRIVAGIAIILLAYGGTTITQNILKPYLVGRYGGMHPAIVLLSTIGGLAWFGLWGFLLGPVCAALFISIWEQFRLQYLNEKA